MERNVAIICNPKSGKGKPLKLLPPFIQYLSDSSIEHQAFTSTLPASLNGFTDLVILGGDGTLNFVLNHFKSIAIPVGIIPCGTGNDVGFGLLGKLEWEVYFEKAIHAAPHKMDAGLCNNRYFLNGVGIGFDGWVVRKLLAKKLFTGMAAYYSTVVSLLLFYKESGVTISCDGKTSETEIFMFTAANGKTVGGGFTVAPKASFSDGVLDFLTVSKINLWNRIKYLPIIEKGKHLEKPERFIQYAQGKTLRIKASRKLQAHLDGEWMESEMFDIKILPSYLSVRF